MPRERNIGLGVVFGFFFACIYSLIALVIFLFRGNAPYETNEVSLGTTIAVYFLGGIIGGAIVGYLLPWTRRRLGSVIVGMIAALPVCLGFGLAVYGPTSQWDEAVFFATIMTAVLLGGYAGYIFWSPEDQEQPSR